MKQLKQERNSELLVKKAKRTERRHLFIYRSEVERELWQSFLLLYSTKLFLQKVRFPLNHYKVDKRLYLLNQMTWSFEKKICY